MSTIENINNTIVNKIQCIRDILDIMSGLGVNNEVETLDCINDDYIMGTVNILSNYFSTQNNDDKRKYYNIYILFINKENIINKLDKLLCEIKNILETISNLSDDKRNNLFDSFNMYDSYTTHKYNKIPSELACFNCNDKLEIDSISSSLLCKKCGFYETTHTNNIDDELPNTIEYKTKQSTYDPTKYCRFWINRIQARESIDIPECVFNDIKKCIVKNKNNEKKIKIMKKK